MEEVPGMDHLCYPTESSGRRGLTNHDCDPEKKRRRIKQCPKKLLVQSKDRRGTDVNGPTSEDKS